MLRTLFRILCPYPYGQRDKHEPGLSTRLRLWLFGLCVKTMRRRYRLYAHSDEVRIGNITIVEELRDEEFESWLALAGYEMWPKMNPFKHAPLIKGFDEAFFFFYFPLKAFFNLSSKMTITFEGTDEKVIIEHNTTTMTDITGPQGSKVSMSNSHDVLTRSVLKVKLDPPIDWQTLAENKPYLRDIAHPTPPTPKAEMQEKPEKSEKPAAKAAPKPRRKVTLNPGGTTPATAVAKGKAKPAEPSVKPKRSEKPHPIVPPQPIEPPKPIEPPAPKPRQMKGVEVDESF